MKELILTFILFTLTLFVFGQDPSDSLSNTTFEENSEWLTILKDTEKNQQLTLIQNRFFRQTIKADNEYQPLIVIDGVPVNSEDNRKRDFVLNSLTVDNVDIDVSDKEPTGLYTNRRYTGLIIITITDKKVSKKFRRLD